MAGSSAGGWTQAIFRLREPAWAEIVPFLQFDLEIRIANMSSSTPA
jgi:hypothetical protein